jgi:HAD superfamily hydrolase (TIGR01450 family)
MSLEGAIVDLDGTVYRDDKLLPGAAAGVAALRRAGLSLCFFSNNPTRNGEEYVTHLQKLGIDARDGEACSAGVATTRYLRKHHADDAVMLVGSAALADQLRAGGLTLTDDPGLTEVLVGSWDPEFDYDDMDRALQAVDDRTPFLGTDPDRVFPGPDDRLVPGSGAVVGALARTIGREPDAILGKPSETALELAIERLGVPAERCLVVGDRLDTDLAMGDRAGMTTVLVLSGVATRADIATGEVEPDHVVDNLGEIGEISWAARDGL